jgi:hypothetical protein
VDDAIAVFYEGLRFDSNNAEAHAGLAKARNSKARPPKPPLRSKRRKRWKKHHNSCSTAIAKIRINHPIYIQVLDAFAIVQVLD